MGRLLLVILFAAIASLALPQVFPARPDGAFIADQARLINTQDAQEITRQSQQTLRATGAPIVVATIQSLADMQAEGVGIERYARGMFDTWKIGSTSQNHGVLVLVSKNDHLARIEFGADWQSKYDADAHQIMVGTMIPAFKTGDYSGGLVRGVTALAQLTASAAGVTTQGPGVQNSQSQTSPSQNAPGSAVLPYNASNGAPAPNVHEGGPPMFGALIFFLAFGVVGILILVLVFGAVSRRVAARPMYRSYGTPMLDPYGNPINGPIVGGPVYDPAMDIVGAVVAAEVIDSVASSFDTGGGFDNGAGFDPGAGFDQGSGFDPGGGGFDTGGGFDSGGGGGGGDTGSW